MKRFKWRLQSVLRVREKQEQLKRAELFELTQKLDLLRDELIRQKKILSDSIDNLAKEDPKSRLEKQGFFMVHTKANDEAIREIETSIHEMEIQREEKMNEVVELKKMTEGLSKLRAKAKREFVAEQEKLEQKASDEMTTYRFAREKINQANVETMEA